MQKMKNHKKPYGQINQLLLVFFSSLTAEPFDFYSYLKKKYLCCLNEDIGTLIGSDLCNLNCKVREVFMVDFKTYCFA